MSKLDRLTPSSLATNPRANLASWKRYEPLVFLAYKAHPTPTHYRPESFSVYTVASQLRDAIRGKLAFDYPSEISTFDLQRWYSEIVIRNGGDHVYIGPLERTTATVQGNATPASPLSFAALTLESLAAFELLLSQNLLSGPVTIASPPPDLSSLPLRDNVERVLRPDGSLLLL